MSETTIETMDKPVNHLGMTEDDWYAPNNSPSDSGDKKAWVMGKWFEHKPEVQVKETTETKKPGWASVLLAMLIANRMKGHQKH